MLGYDTLFINGLDDDELIRIALKEDRVLLTKDSGIMLRRIVTTGKLKAILIREDDVREQLRQVVEALNLGLNSDPFSLCLECNAPLVPRKKEEVRDLVPPYTYQTHDHYMQCPNCQRIFWQGTHWQKMTQEIQELSGKQ